MNPNPAPFKPEPFNGIFMQPGEILRKTLSQMTLCSTVGGTLNSLLLKIGRSGCFTVFSNDDSLVGMRCFPVGKHAQVRWSCLSN